MLDVEEENDGDIIQLNIDTKSTLGDVRSFNYICHYKKPVVNGSAAADIDNPKILQKSSSSSSNHIDHIPITHANNKEIDTFKPKSSTSTYMEHIPKKKKCEWKIEAIENEAECKTENQKAEPQEHCFQKSSQKEISKDDDEITVISQLNKDNFLPVSPQKSLHKEDSRIELQNEQLVENLCTSVGTDTSKLEDENLNSKNDLCEHYGALRTNVNQEIESNQETNDQFKSNINTKNDKFTSTSTQENSYTNQNLTKEMKGSEIVKTSFSSRSFSCSSAETKNLEDDFQHLSVLQSSIIDNNSTSNLDDGKTELSSNTNQPIVTKNLPKRKIERPRSVVVTDFWVCEMCTLQNPLTTHRCQVCHWDKNKDICQPPRVRKKWSCEKCTFKNSIKSIICEMCSTPYSTNIKSNSEKSNFSCLINSRKGTKQKYHEIVAYCVKSGDYFVDDSFPPVPKSLFYNPKSANRDLVTDWIRPNEILIDEGIEDVPWVTFRLPVPTDISQGVLGNCWLLSALAVIAERKELVEKILVTQEISEVGAYLLRLCKDGTWTSVIIDDLLPCDKKKNLVYSQAKRKQLWVPLIEKGLAKLHGCYEALVSGRAIEGLATLTGYPCESIPLQNGNDEELDRDLVWAQLLSCHAARFLMGASCGGGNMKVDEEEYREKGLRPRHAYSLLSVFGSHGLRLLRLRNPWGRYSWKGDWSDSSSKWSHELRKKLMPRGSEDGVFWISFDDMLKYFDCIDVCKVRDFWHERRLQGTLPPSADFQHLSCVLITVMEATEVEITLFQEGHRSSEKSQRSQLDLCVALFRGLETSQSNSQKLVLGRLVEHSKRQVRGFVGCHKMVEPGFYLAVPLAFNHWHTGLLGANTPYPRYVMSIHSSKKILSDQIAPPAYMLADAIIRLTMERGQRHEGREGMTAYYLTKGWAGLVVVVENRHEDKWIQVKCDCQESYNVVSTRSQLKTVDAVPPLHRQVIIILTQLEGSGGFSIAHRLTHRPSLTNGLHDWAPGNTDHWPIIGEDVEGLHSPRPLIE